MNKLKEDSEKGENRQVKMAIFESQWFSKYLLKRNFMKGSISIENISFSRNCDITIKIREQCLRCSYFAKV